MVLSLVLITAAGVWLTCYVVLRGVNFNGSRRGVTRAVVDEVGAREAFGVRSELGGTELGGAVLGEGVDAASLRELAAEMRPIWARAWVSSASAAKQGLDEMIRDGVEFDSYDVELCEGGLVVEFHAGMRRVRLAGAREADVTLLGTTLGPWQVLGVDISPGELDLHLLDSTDGFVGVQGETLSVYGTQQAGNL